MHNVVLDKIDSDGALKWYFLFHQKSNSSKSKNLFLDITRYAIDLSTLV